MSESGFSPERRLNVEIAPFQDRANVHFYTGVVGLFTRPS